MILPALIPVIARTTLTAPAASVTITVPSGYEILFLEWSNVYGDQAAVTTGELTMVSGAGGYDDSYVSFGGASATTNAANSITIMSFGDTGATKIVSSGSVVIFNRASQEKVVIGTETYFDDSAGAGADDLVGKHIKGKDRDTSNAITSLTIIPSAGNLAANSRFIVRGLSTAGAPALGSPDIVQFIGSADLTIDTSGHTFVVPSGYERLWLFWHDIQGSSTSPRNIYINFNSDSGNNYDWSRQAFGSASSTNNADTKILFGIFADSDEVDYANHGFMEISNRRGQEKVLIGTEVRHVHGTPNDEDLTGYHLESKWRNKEDEIASIAIVPSATTFDAGKIWLLGVKI